jgi:two-component system, OmpR family, alkaline phosphatase synthesis response regulator PhoP
MPKILIIDDDPLIRNLLGQILEPFEERGVQLFFAQDGIVALDMVRREEPDIVFLDVMMPKMNGFDVCSILKKGPQREKCYVIMLTAKGQKLDREKAKYAGADFYITKPFNISEITNKVKELLGMHLS